MGSKALNIAIESRFSTLWGVTTPIKFDNVPFDVQPVSWVSLSVMDGDSDKASLGAGVQLRRTLGTVQLDIYAIAGSSGGGSGYARQLTDSIKAIFRDVQLSDGAGGTITFYEGKVKRIGEQYWAATGSTTGTTQWYQMLVSIPFFYDSYI